MRLIKYLSPSYLIKFIILPLSIALLPALSLAADNLYLNSIVKATVQKNLWAQYPKIDYGTGAKAELLKKGEYLTKAGDCIACHTNVKDGGQAFAGGFAVVTPFGTIYTPNITSDKKNGIGSWTNAQFIKAMQHGVSPAGKYYYPAFPYLYFNRVKKEDLIAIKAYLDATPPAQVVNRKNSMMFPFNWRFLQLGWRTMFFEFQKKGPFKPDPTQSAQWNRGAYLVQGLGHCGMCHTPMWHLISNKFPLGAPKSKYSLSGGEVINGMLVPNINSAALKDVPIPSITDVFEKCTMIGGGSLTGDMLELEKDSLRYLKKPDLVAIATYIKSVKSKVMPVKKVSAASGPGAKIYGQYCATCHAHGAADAPKYGDASQWQPLIKNGLDSLYTNAINGIKAMPPKGTCLSCTDQQIKDAVNYIVSSVQGKSAKPMGKPIKKLTLADGKVIYGKYCAACHTGSYQGAPVLGDKQAWMPLINKGIDTLILNSIHGINNMPPKGGCASCNDAQVIAAVKYMVHTSKQRGDYRLW